MSAQGRHTSPTPLVWVTFALVTVVSALPASEPLFHALFPALQRPLYTRASFADLAIAHVLLAGLSTAAASIVAIAVGTLVTRRAGRTALPLVSAVAAVGQTFPPVAVLAIAVPILGYGEMPTFVALTLYALLPVLAATIAGLDGVPPHVRDAADAMGFSPLRRLIEVELPLALPVILTGVRTAAIINIGTATIGSTVGALTLGSPIIEGLSGSNTAYVIQGALVVALLAIAVDQAFEVLIARLERQRGP